jgi:hypothetical protein
VNKQKTTHVALRRNKAFMGFSYNSIEYIINQTIDDLRAIKCVRIIDAEQFIARRGGGFPTQVVNIHSTSKMAG